MNVENLGMGVMINMLCDDGSTARAAQAALGREIKHASLRDETLRLDFADGSALKLWDDGQSCCESRYMTTDDDLEHYAGAKLLGIELRDAPDGHAEYDSHDCQFLDIRTSKGVFTMTSHNEHNGCYGGFSVKAELVEPAARLDTSPRHP